METNRAADHDGGNIANSSSTAQHCDNSSNTNAGEIRKKSQGVGGRSQSQSDLGGNAAPRASQTAASMMTTTSKGKQKAASTTPAGSDNSSTRSNSCGVAQLALGCLSIDAGTSLQALQPPQGSQVPPAPTPTPTSCFPHTAAATSITSARNKPQTNSRNPSINVLQPNTDLSSSKASLNKKNLSFGNSLFIDTSIKKFNTSSPPRRRNPQSLGIDNSFKQPTNTLRSRLYRSPDLSMSPLSDDLETPLFSANPLSAVTPLISSVEDYHGGNYFKTFPATAAAASNTIAGSSNLASQSAPSSSSNNTAIHHNNSGPTISSSLFTVSEDDTTGENRMDNNANNNTNYSSDNASLGSISSQLFGVNGLQVPSIQINENNSDINNDNRTTERARIRRYDENAPSTSEFAFAEMQAKIGDDDPFFKSSEFDQVIDLLDILKSEKKKNRSKDKPKPKTKKKSSTVKTKKEGFSRKPNKNASSGRKKKGKKSGKEKYDDEDNNSGYEGEDEDEGANEF